LELGFRDVEFTVSLVMTLWWGRQARRAPHARLPAAGRRTEIVGHKAKLWLALFAVERRQIYQLRGMLKASVAVAGLLVTPVVIHEVHHFKRYGHLAPFGLHADFTTTTSQDILGVRGTATIYQARSANYGVPAPMVVCDYLDSGMPATMVNSVVERQRSSNGPWEVVPEWSRLRPFCRRSFEVTETHLVRHRLWPGRTVELGEAIPAQNGFRVGDHGRFTFLPRGDDFSDSVSTVSFYVGEAGP
jgi:hypothetical protein